MKAAVKTFSAGIAAVAAGWLLSGCGGGGGSGSSAAVAGPTPVSAPAPAAAPPAATPAQYLTWASARKSDGSVGVVVIDEATPATPRLAFTVTDLGTKVISSLASTVDNAARTETLLGDAALFYIEGGVIKKVSLKKSAAQTPQQLSTLTNACGFFADEQIDLLGEDVWLGVTTPGADNNCATVNDNGRFYVRSTMTAASPALAWSNSVNVVSGLTASDGTVSAFLVNEIGSTLALYDTGLQRVASVANGGGVTAIADIAVDLSAVGNSYFAVNDTLRRLTWTATTASLSASLYAFQDAAATRSGGGDTTGTYFTDGNRVLRIDPTAVAATPLAVINAVAQASDPIAVTPTAIIIAATTSANRATIIAQPRTGAAAIDLTGQTTPAGRNAFLEALSGETVVFTQTKPAGDFLQVRAVASNGQNGRVLADNTTDLFKGQIFNPTVSLNNDTLGAFGLDSVLSCLPLSGQPDCSPGGTVTQYDVATGTATVMGNLLNTAGLASPFITNIAVSGQPFALSVFGINPSLLDDAYLGVAGRANSLIPLLRNRP